MKIDGANFDNLSDLREQLCKLESASRGADRGGLKQAREDLIAAVGSYTCQRYHLGRTLLQYKVVLKAEHVWTAAAKAIGAAIGRDERTIYRIVDDFERAVRLPDSTIQAMLDQKIDPAERRNARGVEHLIQMPEPATREEAAAAVASAFEKRPALRGGGARVGSVNRALDAFADQIVKQFEQRYRSVAPERRNMEVRYVLERIVNTLRSPISDLRQFSRPALVPKPVEREAA